MKILIFLTIFSVTFANDEGLNDCTLIANCSDSEDSSEQKCSDCVNQYEMLESYILGNDIILSTLAEAFYPSDHDPAEFVKITYHYQIRNDSNDNSNFCCNKKRLYFWATSPSYLLGPKPMNWLSLFAINPSQSSVSVQLPCLQEDSVRDLLSRFTYLVS